MSILLGAARRNPVYRLRYRVGLDSYGDPTESWDSPDRSPLKGATWSDVEVEEAETASGRIVRKERRLRIPGAADLTEKDRVDLSGEVWRVDGPPLVRRGLALGVETVAVLRRLTAREEPR